jgi:hypothetical protein
MISLITLENEYNTLFNKYKSEYNDFFNTPITDFKKLIPLQNKAFWGTNSISDSTVSSVNECIDNCNKTQSCTGATFNPDNNQCYLRSGIATPVVQDNYTALVSFYVYKLSILNSYNQQLQTLITKINDFIASNSININTKTLLENSLQLKKDFDRLTKENQNINDLQQDINTQNNSAFVNANYAQFNLYFVIFLFIIISSFFILFPDSAPTISLLFIIAIILFFS